VEVVVFLYKFLAEVLTVTKVAEMNHHVAILFRGNLLELVKTVEAKIYVSVGIVVIV
jgi:hypothetical protein